MPTFPKGTRQWAEQSLEDARSSLRILMGYQRIGAFDPSEIVFVRCGDNCARHRGDEEHGECKPGGYLCPAILDRKPAEEFRHLCAQVGEYEALLRTDLPEATETIYTHQELECGYGQRRLF